MVVTIVNLTVRVGTEEEFIRLSRQMTEETRKEPGCLHYLVHQSKDNPRRFAFYEQYRDEAALEAHWAAPHYAQFILGGIDRLVESRTRERFTPVD